jgi:LytS/YehU family sensor histidine kinase
MGFLKLRLDNQITSMFLTTVGFSFLFAFATIYLEDLLNLTSPTLKEYGLVNKTLRASFGSFLFLIIWNLIYFTYHYIEKTRQEQLDKIRLESLVKELELKTIKAHINPHFIFNALNSIRALVDENPERARQAITELSNILRSSMQAEKTETASLQKELNIVKDYLALEHIRFEDRLKVEFDVDEHTLDQPVPPMMLQTLVENAIKHGISKRVDGGVIKIKSDFKSNLHQLVVQNTGHLNGDFNPDGFGLYSTQNRLMLLYGDKANFEIKNNSDNMVEAVVTMPTVN